MATSVWGASFFRAVAGTSDTDLQHTVAYELFCTLQQGIQSFLGMGMVTAIVTEQYLIILVKQNQLDGCRADINTGTIGFHFLYYSFHSIHVFKNKQAAERTAD